MVKVGTKAMHYDMLQAAKERGYSDVEVMRWLHYVRTFEHNQEPTYPAADDGSLEYSNCVLCGCERGEHSNIASKISGTGGKKGYPCKACPCPFYVEEAAGSGTEAKK